MIEELGTIVAVKTQERKRNGPFYVFDLFNDIVGALVPDCPNFSPSRVDIGHGEAPNEVSTKTGSAVSNGIGFHETRLGNVPVVGTDGNMVAKHGAGLGTAQAFAIPDTQGLEHAVKSRPADSEQLVMDIPWKDSKGLLKEWQPHRHARLESSGAHEVGSLPDGQKCLEKGWGSVS